MEHEEESGGQWSLTSTMMVVQEDNDSIYQKYLEEYLDAAFPDFVQQPYIEEHGDGSPGFDGACCWSWAKEAAVEKGLVSPGVKGFGFQETAVKAGKFDTFEQDLQDSGGNKKFTAKAKSMSIGLFLGFLLSGSSGFVEVEPLLGKEQNNKGNKNFRDYSYEGTRPPGQQKGVFLMMGTADHASKDDMARQAWHDIRESGKPLGDTKLPTESSRKDSEEQLESCSHTSFEESYDDSHEENNNI